MNPEASLRIQEVLSRGGFHHRHQHGVALQRNDELAKRLEGTGVVRQGGIQRLPTEHKKDAVQYLRFLQGIEFIIDEFPRVFHDLPLREIGGLRSNRLALGAPLCLQGKGLLPSQNFGPIEDGALFPRYSPFERLPSNLESAVGRLEVAVVAELMELVKGRGGKNAVAHALTPHKIELKGWVSGKTTAFRARALVGPLTGA